MDKKKLFGLKIKEVRKKSGLTQEKFCEQIGIEPTSLSNIENGKSFPSMQTILTIFKVFNVSPQDFFEVDYLQKSEKLEEEIIDIIKKQPSERKKILYRIIKSFDI